MAYGVLLSMAGIVQKALWSGKVYGFWEPVNKGVVAMVPSAFHVLRRQRSTAKGRMLGAYLALVIVPALVLIGFFAREVRRAIG